MNSHNLIQVNPIVSPQWDSAVLNGSPHQIFHLSCWIKTLIDTYNFGQRCFMLESDPACTIPLLITKSISGFKKAVVLPFSDECDIHCENMPHDVLVSKLLSIAQEEKLGRLEFRGTTHFQPAANPSHSCWGHYLQLGKEDDIWKKFSSSKKRNIKKAQSENISVNFSNDKNAVKQYYFLHCLTRKRHGLPPQPVSFFEAIYDNVISKNFGEIALAYSGKDLIAGAVYLMSGSTVVYKFGASDKHLQLLRANDLLMWNAIQRYAQKGFTTFSFGKTEKFHNGLSHFKEGFGAQRFDLHDYCYDTKTARILKTSSPSFHPMLEPFFKIMPVPFLRFFGELLYKYSA